MENHQELKSYIRDRLAAGTSRAVIEQELLNVGWKPEVVRAALRSKRDLRTPLLIAGGVLLLVVSGTAFALWGPSTQGARLPIPSEWTQPPLSHGEEPALANPEFFAKVKQDFIDKKSDLVEADLSTMTLNVYKAGELALTVPIKTKGREGSWWETPAGLYSIQTKEDSHFSSFGRVYQPYSMAFQGNFFIHGWPYYPGGEPVASTYSGGCIRLADEDAKRVFDMVDVGTPVLVFEHDFSSDQFSYADLNRDSLSAGSYLAADIKNNEVFFSKTPKKQVPIASITKLMTALIATEYLNLDTVTTVPREAIVYTSLPRLRAGQEISIYQLLFPLLTESSNEAAETIARHYGRESFVAHMNEKAKAIGMTDTTFVDPSGASAENVSTAEDLFMLAKYVYNNRSFVFNITSGDLKGSAYGASVFTDLRNLNHLITSKYFIGGKVGQTLAAKETDLIVLEIPIGSTTRPIVLVVLGSEDSEQDSQTLLDRVLDRYAR
ncbi:MAG: L,D-transpeptidase family protein [Candidatus Pacebacteria bacterium]|nr:L,D-transpeptidase family protein [Candidatus Paceibacterota bacterium]